VDDQIYVLGGLVSTPQGTAVTNSVERYLAEDDRWESAADLPEARHHAMAATHSGLVYFLGGFDATGFNPVASAWSLDPSTQTWSELADLPESLGAGAAASLNGLIYVAGGVPDGSSFFSYDPATGTWQVLQNMSRPREHVAAVAYQGKIWVLGGRWGEAMLQSVEIFDPATGAWSAGPDLLEARSGFGASAVDELIVVAGGEVFNPTRALDSVEVFDGSNWVAGSPLPLPLHGVPLATIGDRVFVMSGSREAAAVDNSGEVWSLIP
jgi:non-specific serine/threonine protein kinase